MDSTLSGFIFRVLVWVLIFIKFWEHIAYLIWLFKNAKPYQSELFKLLSENSETFTIKNRDLFVLDEKYSVPWPLPWRLVRKIKFETSTTNRTLSVLCPIIKFTGIVIDRYPTIIVLVSILLVFFHNSYFSIIEIFLLTGLIVVQLLNILLSRLVLGYGDNFRCDFAINPNRIEDDYEWSKSVFVAKYVYGIAVYYFSTVVCFASIFYHFYTIMGPDAFSGITEKGFLSYVQFLYFSLITITTVGYGDILPKSLVTQVFVGVEVLVGVGLIIFVLFSLSNTFTKDSD